jgi:hypothetical protein
MCLPIVGLWLFAKSSFAAKVLASVALLVLAGIGVLCMCVLSAFAIAEVQSGRINFYFFGIRTRSIPLDDSTFFELRKMGRLKVLSIQSNGSTYVPNGALGRSDVVDLLRANGVAERNAV